jgi:zinc transport system substrate-binding protein
LKKLWIAIITLITALSLIGCTNKSTNPSTEVIKNNSDSKIQVLVSFNPLKEFVSAIGKDKVIVSSIIPEGTEPHDFELKAKDLTELSKANIFIYNGLGMEPWVEKSLQSINNKNLVVVDASTNANIIKNIGEKEIEEHGQNDPHIWLSLKEAKVEAKNIMDALIKIDMNNKDYYEKNYADFSNELDGLFNEYKPKFDSLANKNFVTGHAAFAYLCRDFGLEQSSVEDVFAEGEPTAKKMKELIDYCNNNKIKTIFMEELASPKVSETLAKEVTAKVEKIYTIESNELNKNYIDTMKENLEKIYNSLK